jgi:DNA-binding CsgD family transcriptional regulator
MNDPGSGAAEAGPPDPWALALRVAEGPRGTGFWPQELADAIEAAVRPDAAAVFLCALGDMLHASSATAPREHASLGQRLVGEFLPRVQRAGLDTPWEILSAEPDLGERAITRPIRTELLEPAGFEGIVGLFMRSREGMVAGWIAVFTRSASDGRRGEIVPRLDRVRRAAEAAVRSSIFIATALGARFPKISPDCLSVREREIARLAAHGFSDLNIARSLAITEGTVGRHLHNIYRKLGASSRVELVDLLCMGE